jgi:Xaa-Pro aminopeptidase
MKSYFNNEFFAGNRARLRELFTGTAPIVIAANGLLQRGADSPFAFRQDASFWYLTGINEPDVLLVMDRDSEYLIVPARDHNRQVFDGAIKWEELSRCSGIKTIMSDEDGWQQLGNRAKKVKHIATLPPAPTYLEHYGMYTNPARAVTVQRLKTYNIDLELLDIGPHLSRQRMIKQAAEIKAIQQAIDITVDSLKVALTPAKLKKYGFEYELEAQIGYGFRGRGAAGHAFEPIVASGPRACTLHNVANDGRLARGDLVVIDVGAEVEGYAADITRTVSLGPPSKRQQAVHAAVLEAQQFAFSLLRPGVSLKQYEQDVEHFIGEKLRELGLIKTISQKNVRKYCPHAISHFLGLNVHDIGDYDRPLGPGVILTVEPGIYIPKEGIGVRIEDDVLITEQGHAVLSDKLPRDLC